MSPSAPSITLTPVAPMSGVPPDAVDVVRLDANSHARRSRVELSLPDLPLKPDQLIELIPPALREEPRQARDRG